MKGTLYGVGVGPGDPELITLKAVRRIQECDIIGIPAKEADVCVAYRIAREAVSEIESKPVLAVPVPMAMKPEVLAAAYDAGGEKIIEELEKGKKVAFLNLGDPTIYGSYMELHSRVSAAGYPAEIVNGVPSFCAVAAKLEIAIGSRGEEIHILPARYHMQELETLHGTKVLMKSAGKTGEVKKKILDLEEKGEIKSYAVTNCGMEQEVVWKEIRNLEEEAGYFTTIIVQEVHKV